MSHALKHTKEQWLVDGTTVYALEHDGWSRGQEQFRNRFSANVQGRWDVPKEEYEANARLMASAPELLKALQSITNLYDTDEVCRSTPEYINARAAISKALGE